MIEQDKKNISISSDQEWKNKMLDFVVDISSSTNSFPQQVLKMIAAHFGYKRLLFFPYYSSRYGPGTSQKDLLNNFTSYNLDYKHLNIFAKSAYKSNIFSPPNLPPEARVKKVLTIKSLMSYEEYETTEWHRNMVAGGGYYHACIHLLNKSQTAQEASINIFHTKSEGEFTDCEVRMFEYLSDFLSNMLQLRLQLSNDQSMETAVNTMLKNLALGVVCLDDQLSVIEANHMARQLCKEYLVDYDDNLVNRSALYLDEKNYDVQKVIDSVGSELLSGQPVYEKREGLAPRYSFYPTSFVSFGVIGILSNRYMVFIQKEKDVETAAKKEYATLTKREKEILGYVFCGHSNEQIGRELNVSIYTVRTHVSNLYHKFDVKNRVELMAILK